MKKRLGFTRVFLLCLVMLLVFAIPSFAYAAEGQEAMDSTSVKAIAAAVTISLGAVAAAIAMGLAISKSSDSIARQPEAEGSIRNSLLLGLVFIETAVIYTLVVAIMIIFVL